MRKFCTTLLLAIVMQNLVAQQATLLFFGDIMGHSGQINSAQQADGSYDYEPTLKYIEPAFRSADIVVGNLEVTLAGPPYTGYPAFSSPDALAYAYKNAGVNFLVTANNHSYDRGQKGMERTLDVIEGMYFNYTGTFKDSTDFRENNPRMIEINGIRLAILNYTYGTNGIVVRQPNIVNHITEEIADHTCCPKPETRYDNYCITGGIVCLATQCSPTIYRQLIRFDVIINTSPCNLPMP